MFGWGVLAVLVVLAAFPKTLGWTHVRLLEWTDKAVRNATPRRVLFWIVVIVAAAAFGQIAAADMAWLAAIDVATYVEISIAVAITGAAVRIAPFRKAVALSVARAVRDVRRRLGRVRNAGRAQRTQRKAPPPPEDWAPAWA